MYGFIQSLAGEYAVETTYRLLGISRSACYQWLRVGTVKDAGEKKNALEEQIVSVFQEYRRRYGIRRIVAELQAGRIAAGAYQVCKVLRQKGLQAIQPRRFVPNTMDSHHGIHQS